MPVYVDDTFTWVTQHTATKRDRRRGGARGASPTGAERQWVTC